VLVGTLNTAHLLTHVGVTDRQMTFNSNTALHSIRRSCQCHEYDQWLFTVFRPLTYISEISEHDITNVLVKIEDVPVPAVTVAILWQHWLALLWLLQWAWCRI